MRTFRRRPGGSGFCPPQASTCERLFAVLAVGRLQLPKSPACRYGDRRAFTAIMKSLRLLLFLFTLPLLSFAQRQTLIVDENTTVRLRLARNLSWADARTGDRIPFEVLEDVTVKGKLVIERGAIALGTIADIEQDRSQSRGDRLGVTLDFVRLVDGEKIALHSLNGPPYFLLMNVKAKTLYAAGTECAAYTYGRADLDRGDFPSRP